MIALLALLALGWIIYEFATAPTIPNDPRDEKEN